jgi:polyisoprenoid-binding protein YceI
MPLLLLTVLLSTRAASAQQPVTADSVVYRLASSSSLQVKTGKAGLFGFAGHSHLIQARAFAGEIVYYPRDPSSSRLNIRVLANSLEVLTPHDTAEIRQVTETMRTKVLRTAKYPEIRLVSRRVEPNDRGFHIVAALTLAGQTRELPIDVATRIGADTLEATSTFSVKQTDFGIKPTSAGPGGTVKVANRVTFEIRAIAVRAGTRHEDVQAAWVRSNGGQRPDSVEATGEGPCRIALTRPGAVYSFLGCRTDL